MIGEKTSFKIDFLSTAKSHRQTDKELNRAWSCGCVACLRIKDSSLEVLAASKRMLLTIKACSVIAVHLQGHIKLLDTAIAKAEGKGG